MVLTVGMTHRIVLRPSPFQKLGLEVGLAICMCCKYRGNRSWSVHEGGVLDEASTHAEA